MSVANHQLLSLTREELAIVVELLASERDRLVVEIRHTDHRAFREELRNRLTVLEGLIERSGGLSGGGGTANV